MAQFAAEQLYALARRAGFGPDAAATMTAIALAESGGDSRAVGPQGPGLWPIDPASFPDLAARHDLTDPPGCAAAAFELSGGGTDFSAWRSTHAEPVARFLRHRRTAQAAATAYGDGPGRGLWTPASPAVEPPPDPGVEHPLDSGVEPPPDSGVEPPPDSGVEHPLDSGVEPPPDSGAEPPPDSGAEAARGGVIAAPASCPAGAEGVQGGGIADPASCAGGAGVAREPMTATRRDVLELLSRAGLADFPPPPVDGAWWAGALWDDRALRAVEELAWRGSATGVLDAAERIRCDAHEIAEARLLAEGLPGALPEPERCRRLLGSAGTGAAARLGLPGGADAAAVRDAAVAEHAHWLQAAEDRLSEPAVSRAATVAVRTCELILAAG